MDKRGSTGAVIFIGFIAMLLVASIAATVFYKEGQVLSAKSYVTTKEISNEVNSGPRIYFVEGTNGYDGDIDNFTLYIRTAPGFPDPISLEESIINVRVKNWTQSLLYSDVSKSKTRFIVTYQANGTDHIDKFLVTGDLIKVDFELLNPITQGQEVLVTFRPNIGYKGDAQFVTPQAITRETINLFP